MNQLTLNHVIRNSISDKWIITTCCAAHNETRLILKNAPWYSLIIDGDLVSGNRPSLLLRDDVQIKLSASDPRFFKKLRKHIRMIELYNTLYEIPIDTITSIWEFCWAIVHNIMVRGR